MRRSLTMIAARMLEAIFARSAAAASFQAATRSIRGRAAGRSRLAPMMTDSEGLQAGGRRNRLS